jgi:hypothetical protein
LAQFLEKKVGGFEKIWASAFFPNTSIVAQLDVGMSRQFGFFGQPQLWE